MSKIIKANNLIYINEKVPGTETIDDFFTSESAETLYEEARLMVEELINEARIKADRIIDNAHLEAKQIADAAHHDAENMKSQAFTEGLQQGKEAGLSEVSKKIAETDEIIKKAYQEKKNILNGLEDEIIGFAVKLAEKVIRTEIANNPEVVNNIAKSLLDMVQDAETVTLKMNPEDYNYLLDFYTELQARLSKGSLKLEQDSTLNKGDCLVISEGGLIIAKIDQEINKLQEILQDVKHND
ncbi:MAG: FliH/SctL family protein [Peptococcaceae bacterium]